MMILLGGTLGADFIDENMIDLANYLEKFTNGNMNLFVTIGTALGAVFAIIVAGIEAYKVMSKGQGFDILAIMRPILFALILANWGAVVSTISFPGSVIESFFREKYETEKAQLVESRELRKKEAQNVANLILEKRAAANEAEKAATAGDEKSLMTKAMDFIDNGGEWLLDNMKGWALIAQSYFQNWIEGGIVWLGELIWQVSVYFIFLIKAIFMAVLSLFGPITFAASILPIWKDGWSQWVGKMVSVSLYGAMAYLVMIFSMQLMKYGVEIDTNVLALVGKDQSSLANYMASGFGTAIQSLVGMLCGAMALKTVPEIATWVIPSSTIMGANSFIQGTAGAVQSKVTKGYVK